MPPASSPYLQQSIGRFVFEDGTVVDDAVVSFGITTPDGPSDGVVIVCPSLTGTPEIQQAWWNDVGAPVARQRYTTLYPHAFADVTLAALGADAAPGMRDLARGIVALVRALGLPPSTFVTGGSMGGMLALEVCLESGAPTHALVLAAPAVQTAWGAGWNLVQLQALAIGGDTQGLALARAVGMMTYRSEQEFEERFGADADRDGRTMAGYLHHHGASLIARFDVREYARRVRAMDTHDVGRHRGGWRRAIAPHADRITAVGIIGDALYSAAIVEAWATATGATFVAMPSIHGHDGFILERARMRDIVDTAFTRATMVTAAH